MRFIRKNARIFKLLFVALLTSVIWFLPIEAFGIEGLTVLQQRIIAIFVFAATMWILEAVPAWTTSLLIIVIMLLTVSNSGIKILINDIPKEQLISYKTIMATFADQTVMLFLGGFILALVASKSGVDITLARAMLKPFGTKPKIVLFGFILVTAVFSMFVSNTATAAMMLTFLTPVLKSLPANERGRTALALAIPIGANIGGMATPIGTPPNGIALGYLNNSEGLNLGIGFDEWMMVMTPLMLVILTIAWFLLSKMYPFRAQSVQLKIIGGARKGWRTTVIYITLAVTILLWMLEKQVGINSYVVALIPVGVFSLTRIIKSKDLKDIDWAVLWMVAGGFALGVGMDKTGLAKTLVESIPFNQWPVLLVMVGSGIICWLLSTFISNSAAAALMVPILAAVGKGMGPMLDAYGGIGTLLIGIALAASFAMALPISTPPNAIAYSTGLIKSSQMCVVGIIIGVISITLGYIAIIMIGRTGFFG
ncbi:MAG: SLC13/DASS family transporter [Bacteroidaceae bacterium]|nr:SLC13/DASS family transporter [Bacteroidaceae bacterium]MBQ3622349.1 SLC13/DASS family transporter [Bacteroidaceae bacterium]